MIWILPVPTVYSLNLPFRRKAVLYALLGVSLVSVTCSILRLAFTILWVKSSDISWNYPLIPFFSNMEACVALITTSVPAILPLLRPTRSRKPQASPQPPPQIDVEQAPSSQGEDSEKGEKEWESQNSTAVPSTADQTQRRESKTWSLLSRLHPNMIPIRGRKLVGFGDPNEKVSTYKSASGVSSGPRTELKEFGEEDDEVVPGLKMEPTLKMK